jgi:hypothetical protein
MRATLAEESAMLAARACGHDNVVPAGAPNGLLLTGDTGRLKRSHDR